MALQVLQLLGQVREERVDGFGRLRHLHVEHEGGVRREAEQIRFLRENPSRGSNGSRGPRAWVPLAPQKLDPPDLCAVEQDIFSMLQFVSVRFGTPLTSIVVVRVMDPENSNTCADHWNQRENQMCKRQTFCFNSTSSSKMPALDSTHLPNKEVSTA